MMSERMQHPKLFLARLVLWLLSTWIGTLIVCGRPSLSTHFPYFQWFAKVSPKKREEILMSWSLSYFSLLRMLFISLKFLILLVFFTQVYIHLYKLIYVYSCTYIYIYIYICMYGNVRVGLIHHYYYYIYYPVSIIE